MLINWFTVLAEAINFLILVGLLQRFLYKPILLAIDERAKGIATQLAEAEAKQAEAQRERDDFQKKNEAFDHDRTALLKKVTEEVQVERQRLLDTARQEADALRTRRQDAFAIEQQNLGQEIVRKTQNEVFAISRKTLTDLAATTLEERMTEIFTRRVRELSNAAKTEFTQALTHSSDPMVVRSAFELPAEQQTAIQHALNDLFSAEVPVRYETKPEVIAGIELTANGHKVSWSIAEYLATLEKSTGELLGEAARRAAPPQAVPRLAEDANAKPKPTSSSKPVSNGTPHPNTEPAHSVPKASS